MKDMNSGYSGYSMSKRATEAYAIGERPLSKWTKTLILEEAERIIPGSKAILKPLRKKELANLLLYKSSWHHTSSYANRTDFYSLDEEKIEKLAEAQVEQIIAERTSKKEDVKSERWHCRYLVWSGSRSHPKAKEVEADGTIKGLFFTADDGTRKKITAKGFCRVKKL